MDTYERVLDKPGLVEYTKRFTTKLKDEVRKEILNTESVNVEFMNDVITHANVIVPSGSSLGSNFPSAPTKAGHEFIGWTTEDLGETPNFNNATICHDDTCVHSIWALTKVTVTFMVDGIQQAIRLVDINGSIGLDMPANPSKDGFTFKGWNTNSGASSGNFTSSTTVSENIIVYAIWEEAVTIWNGPDFYVNASTGDDSTGNGSSSKPWKTIDFTKSKLTLDSGATNITVHFANGTYNMDANQRWMVSNNAKVTILGNTGSPSSVIINCTGVMGGGMFTGNGATVTVKGVLLKSDHNHSASGAALLTSANSMGKIIAEQCIFEGISTGHSNNNMIACHCQASSTMELFDCTWRTGKFRSLIKAAGTGGSTATARKCQISGTITVKSDGEDAALSASGNGFNITIGTFSGSSGDNSGIQGGSITGRKAFSGSNANIKWMANFTSSATLPDGTSLGGTITN